MKGNKIREIAETYINGNILDAKRAVKKMRKADFLYLLEDIADLEGECTIDKMFSISLRLTE